MVVLRVREKDDPSVTGALLACFPMGAPPQNVLDGKDGGIEFGCYAQKRERVLMGTTDTVMYEGSASTSATPDANQSRYVIGVYDSEKEQLVLVDPGAVFPLKKRLRKELQMDDSVKEFLDTKMTNAEARLKLLDTFGSKKAQVARRKKLGVQTAEETQESIGAIGSALTKQENLIPTTEEAEDGSAERNALAPKFNAAATSPDEVYRLEDIIPEDQFMLVPTKDVFNALDKNLTEGVPKSIVKHLSVLNYLAGDDRIATAQVISYLWCLIILRKQFLRKDPQRAISEALNCSLKLAKLFLNAFFDSTVDASGHVSYKLSKAGRDTLMLRIAALSLHLSNFSIILNDLSDDLGLPMPQLIAYFQELGCRIQRPGGGFRKKFNKKKAEGEGEDEDEEDGEEEANDLPPNAVRAILKLPLVFPKEKKARGGSRK